MTSQQEKWCCRLAMGDGHENFFVLDCQGVYANAVRDEVLAHAIRRRVTPQACTSLVVDTQFVARFASITPGGYLRAHRGVRVFRVFVMAVAQTTVHVFLILPCRECVADDGTSLVYNWCGTVCRLDFLPRSRIN